MGAGPGLQPHERPGRPDRGRGGHLGRAHLPADDRRAVHHDQLLDLGDDHTTAAPAAPPSLAVTPARVDLGAAAATATLTVRNGGDEPLSWTADPSTAWLRVSPSSGSLDGGEQARVTLSATRDGLPEGDADGRVELTWGGPARSVVVALRVEHHPEISDLSASPAGLHRPCTPTDHHAVEATVTDESALSSVTLQWVGGSGPMTLRAGSGLPALAPTARAVPLRVVATDARGNTASASGPTVTASPCP